MVYRLKVASPDAPHMERFIEAFRTIQALNDSRGYHHIAGFHGAPGNFCWHHQAARGVGVTARMFLPWHRAYLYALEQALQDVDPGVSLPWWDWTEDGIPPAYGAEQIGGESNPLHGSEIDLTPPQVGSPIQRRTARRPGGGMPVFANPRADMDQDGRATLAEMVGYLIHAVPDFETFNDELEHVPDRMHVWVGGDMASVTTAAYDPIFFAHHCMIDRIWYLWQMQRDVDRFPTALRDSPLPPFGRTPGQVLNVQELGYEYALMSAPVPPGGSVL